MTTSETSDTALTALAPREVPPVPPPPKLPGRRRRRAAPLPPDPDALVWEYPMPLLTNPFMLWDLGWVLVISIFLLEVIALTVTFFFSDEPVLLPPQVVLVGFGVVAALFAFVALAVFRNAIHCRFVVDSRGARMEMIYGDNLYERSVGWVLRGLLFFANPLSALSTNLPGIANSSESLPWRDVTGYTVHHRLGVVSLREGWRTALRLYCDPRAVDTLAERVRILTAPGFLTRARRRPKLSHRYRWPFYASWTTAAAVAGSVSLAWYWAADDMVRPAVLAFVLTAAAGWSLPAKAARLVAWPALAASIFLAAQLVPPALERSTFGPLRVSYGWELDTPELVIAAAGCLALVIMSLAAILWRRRPTESAPEATQ